jgi:hypothetical protein
MKSIKLITLGIILITTASCQDSKKSTDENATAAHTTEAAYNVSYDSTKVSFTA